MKTGFPVQPDDLLSIVQGNPLRDQPFVIYTGYDAMVWSEKDDGVVESHDGTVDPPPMTRQSLLAIAREQIAIWQSLERKYAQPLLKPLPDNTR